MVAANKGETIGDREITGERMEERIIGGGRKQEQVERRERHKGDEGVRQRDEERDWRKKIK